MVVWNPRPYTMGLGAAGQARDCDTMCAANLPIYHRDLPTLVLAESQQPEIATFKVPEVPPGRYVLAIYDGFEHRFHYTWQIFTVERGPTETGSASGRGSPLNRSMDHPNSSWVPKALIALAAVLAGFVAGLAITRLIAMVMIVMALMLGLSEMAPAMGGVRPTCAPNCLSPRSGVPGTKVTLSDRDVLLIVWNPRPITLAGDFPPGFSESCDFSCARRRFFHEEVPPVIVAEYARPTAAEFEVPAVPPGQYVVVFYDGSKAGYGFSWDLFRVRQSSTRGDNEQSNSQGVNDERSRQGGRVWPLVLPAVLFGLLSGLIVGRSARHNA
jgi:hypothetical protein